MYIVYIPDSELSVLEKHLKDLTSNKNFMRDRLKDILGTVNESFNHIQKRGKE